VLALLVLCLAGAADADSPLRFHERGATTEQRSLGPAAHGYRRWIDPIQPTGDCDRIDIDLTREELVVWSCGQTVLATPITSGMSGLRTPTGTFTVSQKQRNVYFQSPWPADSPYYFAPMYVAYALEFLSGGYFIHSDPDEPASAYGKGSEDGGYASHGCVHVPDAAMAALYSWTSVGTVVHIHG
jgi:hypothetical protein